MIRYITKRLLWMIPILLGIILLVFTISYFTPGDPVQAMLGSNYTEELYNQKAAELGLDKPFFVRYFNYIYGIVTRFDFGQSYYTGADIGDEIAGKIGVTVKLGVYRIAATLIVGVFFGILSATKQRSVLDTSVTVFAMFIAAMPNFWMGLVLILTFALKLGWLPATGIETWSHWILPTLTQSLGALAIMMRMTRSSVLEVIRQDHTRTARAKGLDEKAVIFRHVLKNSMMPIITIVGMQIGMILAGSVIVEGIFNIPGLGQYMMRGITSRDYPVINGCVLIISTCICVMNLLTDLAYGFVDPRIKAQYTLRSSQKKLKKTLAKAELKEAEAV